MKSFVNIFCAAFVLSFLLTLEGCNPEDARNIAQDAGKIAKDTGKAAGNAQLNDRVAATLAQRKGVNMQGLHIEAKNGVVTITGHVRDANEKRIVKRHGRGHTRRGQTGRQPTAYAEIAECSILMLA